MSDITLILADSMDQGKLVINHHKLNEENCAVITSPSHLDAVKLIPNETLYAVANMDEDMMTACLNKVGSMNKTATINLKIVSI
jgi:hypothetical protein